MVGHPCQMGTHAGAGHHLSHRHPQPTSRHVVYAVDHAVGNQSTDQVSHPLV